MENIHHETPSRQEQESLTGHEVLKILDAQHKREHDEVMTGTQALHAAEVMRLQAAETVALPRPVEEGPTSNETDLNWAIGNLISLRADLPLKDTAENHQRIMSISSKLRVVRASWMAHFTSSKLDKERIAALLYWTDPGHRLTEADLDDAEEIYTGEIVKSGTYRHRAALEAVIRGYLASNRSAPAVAPDAGEGT